MTEDATPMRSFWLFVVITCAAGCASCGASLATDDGVRAAYESATGRELGERACIDRPEQLPGVILVASFAFDRGCALEGVFVGDDFVEPDDATPAVLAHLGWAGASPERRLELAGAWLRHGIHRYGEHIVTEAPEPFAAEGAPAFHPPDIESTPEGGVVMRAWITEPAGRHLPVYHDVEHRIAADGTLTTERHADFAEPPR